LTCGAGAEAGHPDPGLTVTSNVWLQLHGNKYIINYEEFYEMFDIKGYYAI
jgi:hypothetical protein